MKRRVFLAGALALWANRAMARTLMPVHDVPRELLSPPFIDGDGRDLTLADFRGRIVLLNVWATWCAPCRREMPMLDRLQAQLGGSGFHVFPLSIDKAGLEPVRQFYEEMGVRNLGVYLAEDLRAMIAFSVVGLPTTLLIDGAGREIARLTGPAEWDSPEALTQFKTVISQRSN